MNGLYPGAATHPGHGTYLGLVGGHVSPWPLRYGLQPGPNTVPASTVFPGTPDGHPYVALSAESQWAAALLKQRTDDEWVDGPHLQIMEEV